MLATWRGNYLALLPTPAAAQDGDYDGLPDSLELSLAQYFFPILNLHCGTYEGMAYADRRQFYGLSVSGYTNSSNGRIPFTATPIPRTMDKRHDVDAVEASRPGENAQVVATSGK